MLILLLIPILITIIIIRAAKGNNSTPDPSIRAATGPFLEVRVLALAILLAWRTKPRTAAKAYQESPTRFLLARLFFFSLAVSFRGQALRCVPFRGE